MAAEYIVKEGNRQVILCERGIRTFETATRNTLDVSAVPVVQLASHLPVIVDPSHATGRADLVLPLSLAGIAAGADGVLVEMHPNPEHALSDGPQSLSPAAFSEYAEARARPGPLDRQDGLLAVVTPSRRAERTVAVVGVGLMGGSLGPGGSRARWRAARRGLQSQPGDDRRCARARRHHRGGGQPRRGRRRRRPRVRLHAGAAGGLARAPRPRRRPAPEAVVSDVGSTKAMLMDALTADEQSRCVGGHPLCGSETAGVGNARASLYEGATYFLTPGAHVRPAAFQKLYDFLVQIGARPVAVEPHEHDRVLALVSHLPHVLANVLMTQAGEHQGTRDALLQRRSQLSRHDPHRRQQRPRLGRHLPREPRGAAGRARRLPPGSRRDGRGRSRRPTRTAWRPSSAAPRASASACWPPRACRPTSSSASW